MEFKWKLQTGHYTNGVDLYIGKRKMGSVHWDSCAGSGNPNKYKATCLLPGMKPVFDNTLTEEKAKENLEKAVQHWFKGLEG